MLADGGVTGATGVATGACGLEGAAGVTGVVVTGMDETIGLAITTPPPEAPTPPPPPPPLLSAVAQADVVTVPAVEVLVSISSPLRATATKEYAVPQVRSEIVIPAQVAAVAQYGVETTAPVLVT